MLTDRSNTSPAGVPGKRRVTIMTGTFTIGAAGAITAQMSSESSGGAATKTATKTGRYDILTYRPWDKFVLVASIIGPADAAFGNTAANTTGVRNVTPASTTSQGQIQGILASTGADTDFASGTVVEWVAWGFGL